MNAVDVNPESEISIGVEGRTLSCAESGLTDVSFSLDDAAHPNLVNGDDPIDLTLMLDDVIAEHERTRDPWLPSGRGALDVAQA